MAPSAWEPSESSVVVHCFRCDEAVEAMSPDGHGQLWCVECEDFVLTSVRETGTGQRLTGPRRAGVSLLASAMLGMHHALYGPVDDEPPIVIIQDEPERDDDIEVHLEGGPAASWVRLRR